MSNVELPRLGDYAQDAVGRLAWHYAYNKQATLIWLGRWRDHLPPEAVAELQDIVGVPKK